MTALAEDLRRLADRGLESAPFRRESAARLAAAVGADSFCFAAVDPETLMTSGWVTEGIDRAGAGLLYENEFTQPDFLKLRSLARGAVPAAARPSWTAVSTLAQSPRVSAIHAAIS